MTTFVFANNINTTLAAAASNTATTLTLASSVGLPALSSGQIMPLTLNDAATGQIYEIVYVTAISGVTLTVLRAQEGTGAQNWSVGDYAFGAVTAGNLGSMVQESQLQTNQYTSAHAGGTSDAITAAFTPAIMTLTDQMILSIRAGFANATTTPTFTPNSGVISPSTIVKGANQALAVGDISGADYMCLFQWDSGLSKWALLNPATGVSSSGKKPGDIFLWSGTSAPAGSLALPVAATNISRTTYAALFAAIGTTWGAGDGSTTFGMPYCPADQVLVQANSNVGSSTVGQVLSHTHTLNGGPSGSTGGATGSGVWLNVGGGTANATGGTANLPAGVRVVHCVQYQ